MARHTQYRNHNPEVVYIGFEKPRRSNGFGVAGFVFSILGVLTFGLLSPVGLFFSVLGLRKSPRGFATTGTLLGGAGTAFWALIFYAMISASHADHREAQYRQATAATTDVIEKVNYEINEFIIEHKGELPDELEGNRFAVKQKDAWDNELQYAPEKDGFSIISAGPDGEFRTGDDVTRKFDYEVEESEHGYLVEL